MGDAQEVRPDSIICTNSSVLTSSSASSLIRQHKRSAPARATASRRMSSSISEPIHGLLPLHTTEVPVSEGAGMTTYGLLIFDGAEELDFAGPWEVFTLSAMLRDQGDTAVLPAQRPGAVRCGKGMQVLPSFILNDHPALDVLLVPGGMGTRREVSNPAVTGWITTVSAGAAGVTLPWSATPATSWTGT